MNPLEVLVISPHFPPTNAADSQRVRFILPYLADADLNATVLAVSPASVRAPLDPWLEAGLADTVPVHRVKGLGVGWCKVPSMGTLTNRAMGALRKVGSRLLSVARRDGRPFDLIYFSTTQFGIHMLGPYWKRKFAVPFVMDYQDPWVNDYYAKYPEIVPPGGRLKYAISHWLAKQTEPSVLKHCSGITSVSSAYPKQLKDRYSFLTEQFPVLVAPFPGDERDLERVRADTSISQSVFNPHDGCKHWIYIGRGGRDMEVALRGFFAALRSRLQITADVTERGQKDVDTPSSLLSAQKLRIHFVGTSYASAGRGIKTVEPIANEYGLQGVVVEHTDRIPYSQTLRCLLDADALIVPGSNDPGYTASKVYPYLLARKPMLAIFHESSSVADVIDRVGGATLVTFYSSENIDRLKKEILAKWFDGQAFAMAKPLNLDKFEVFTARYQAKQLADFFSRVLEREQC
ncbi:MAG: hypothetical protein ACK5PB_21845 [Pirellula sp.]